MTRTAIPMSQEIAIALDAVILALVEETEITRCADSMLDGATQAGRLELAYELITVIRSAGIPVEIDD